MTLADRFRQMRFVEPIALFALALSVRWFGVSAKPFWLDEVFTVTRSRRGLADLVDDSLTHHHLPTFFLLEHLLLPFGDSTTAMRAIPVMAGAATAALAFLIARDLGSRAAGWLAGLLMTLAPLQVAYAQEARSYTLMMALILFALWGMIRLALAPDAAAMPMLERRGAWTAVIGGTAGALLVLGDALPWLIAANFGAMLAILPRTKMRSTFVRNWLIAQAIILVLTVPLYGAMAFAEHGKVAEGFDWIPPLNLAHVWSDIASLYLLRDAGIVDMQLLPEVVPFLWLLVIVLIIAGFFHLRTRKAPRLILLISFAALPIVLLLTSILVHPMLMPRYLLWSAAPLAIFAGLGVDVLPRYWRVPSIALVAALFGVNLFPYYHQETKPRWDLAAAELAPDLRPGDLLLVSDSAAWAMMHFYLPQLDPAAPIPEVTTRRSHAAAALSAGHQVWAVYGRVGQGQMIARRAFIDQIASLGAIQQPFKVGQGITIMPISAPMGSPLAVGPAAPGGSRAQ